MKYEKYKSLHDELMSLYNKIEYQIRDYKIHLNSSFYKFKKRKINAYWCRANNFGDWLTPVILKYFGYTVLYSSAYDADIIMVGSILEQVPHLYRGKILGAGFIYPESKLSFPKAEILGLRGRLTKLSTGIDREIVLGDPGLLISFLCNKKIFKKYKLGIVPHVSDVRTDALTVLKKNNHIKIIYPQQHPIKVAKDIMSCDAILSSSLHGLIFADSLGIPNRRIIFNKNTLGGNFKFDDYYSVIEGNEKPIENITGYENLNTLVEYASLKNQSELNNIKNKLLSAIENLIK